MRIKKLPYRMRALIACGLLLSTLPLLFKEYIPIPDYMRGLLAGFGLGLEITGLVFARRFQKAMEYPAISPSCRRGARRR